MARVEKNTVDYFPHLVSEGKKMFFIEQKYGNDGYVVWWKILEKLATTDFHFLNLGDEAEIMYLASKCRVSEEKLLNIINDLVKMSAFNKQLWQEAKIIWSDTFIENIVDAYERRKNKCIDLDTLCTHLKSKCILKPTFVLHDVYINTQSRVEETKVDESREEETKKEEREKKQIRALVFLSDREQEKLAEKFNEEDCNWMYDTLHAYKAAKGVEYKSDYGAICKWVKRALQENKVAVKKEKPPEKESKILGAMRAGEAAINYFNNLNNATHTPNANH
jgi:hypothetical protein